MERTLALALALYLAAALMNRLPGCSSLTTKRWSGCGPMSGKVHRLPLSYFDGRLAR